MYITEKRQAEEALQHATDYLLAVFEYLYDKDKSLAKRCDTAWKKAYNLKLDIGRDINE